MQWTRETSRQRKDRLAKWHKWFAWRPVRMWMHTSTDRTKFLEHSNKILWLESVHRKIISSGARVYLTREDAIVDELSDVCIKRPSIVEEE